MVRGENNDGFKSYVRRRKKNAILDGLYNAVINNAGFSMLGSSRAVRWGFAL